MCGNACSFQCVAGLVDNHVCYGLFQSVLVVLPYESGSLGSLAHMSEAVFPHI